MTLVSPRLLGIVKIERGGDTGTEFKRDLEDLRPIGKTLCAFANG